LRQDIFKGVQAFFSIAMGSVFELETQIILASEFSFISKEKLVEFEKNISEVQRMIFGLYKNLND